MQPKNPSETGQTGKAVRDAKGRFAPGTKCGGRPKKPAAIKEMADIALSRLWEIANAPTTKDKDRADIYRWIYEQGYGKATQRIAGDEDGAPIVTVSLDAAVQEYTV